MKEIKGQCRNGTYTTNGIVLHFPLMCFGGFGQPSCKYLLECLEDYREIIGNRRINNIKKKLEKSGSNQ